MKAKKTFVLGLVASLIVGAGAFAAVASMVEPIHVNQLFADDQSLTLNEGNRPAFEGGNCWGENESSVINEYTTIDFYDCESYGGAYVHIGGYGYFQKQQACNGLSQMSIDFNGAIKVLTSYLADFSDSDFVILDSGIQHSTGQYKEQTISVFGNYWKIESASGNEAVIQSLTIHYACDAASTKPGYSDPTDYSNQQGFSRLEDVNKKLYFALDLAYPGGISNKNNYALYANAVDGVDINNIRAEFLKYHNSLVTAYFNLSDWFNGLDSDSKTKIKNENWHDLAGVTFKYDSGSGLLANFKDSENINNGTSIDTTVHLLSSDLQMNIWGSSNNVRFSFGKVISGFDDDGNGGLWGASFGWYTEKNDTPHFKLSFKVKKEQYQSNNYEIYKKAFSIKSDNGSQLHPYHVTYNDNENASTGGSGYRNQLTLYFSFDALGSVTEDSEVYMHLYYFEGVWDGDRGNFKRAGSAFGNLGKVGDFSYQNGGKKYEVGYLWDIPVVYISSSTD